MEFILVNSKGAQRGENQIRVPSMMSCRFGKLTSFELGVLMPAHRSFKKLSKKLGCVLSLKFSERVSLAIN